MHSDRGDTEVIYLKDEEFLPHDVEVPLGTLVRFINCHSHDSFEGSSQSPVAGTCLLCSQTGNCNCLICD